MWRMPTKTQNISITLESSLMSPSQWTPFHPRGNHWSDFWYHRLLLPILECLINGIIHYVLFCVWLFTQHNLCEILPSSLLHVSVVCFFSLLSGLPLYEHTVLFIHSPTGWTSGLFLVFDYHEKSSYEDSCTRLICGHIFSFLLD